MMGLILVTNSVSGVGNTIPPSRDMKIIPHFQVLWALEDKQILHTFTLCIKSALRGPPTEQPDATVAKRCGLFNIKKAVYYARQIRKGGNHSALTIYVNPVFLLVLSSFFLTFLCSQDALAPGAM